MQFSTVCSWNLCCSYFIGLIQFFQQNLLSVLLLDSLLGPQLAKTRSVILEESRLFQPLSIRLEGSLRSFEMEMSEAHIFKIFICLSWWANGTKYSQKCPQLPKTTLKPKQKCTSKPWLWKIKWPFSLSFGSDMSHGAWPRWWPGFCKGHWVHQSHLCSHITWNRRRNQNCESWFMTFDKVFIWYSHGIHMVFISVQVAFQQLRSERLLRSECFGNLRDRFSWFPLGAAIARVCWWWS